MTTCAFPYCQEDALVNTPFCPSHTADVGEFGSAVDRAETQASRPYRHKKKGYFVRDVPGRGTIREARYQMELILGRHLFPEEQVYHRDGDRDHNDPSNLRLRYIKKPASSDVDDLVPWVRELISKYPERFPNLFSH